MLRRQFVGLVQFSGSIIFLMAFFHRQSGDHAIRQYNDEVDRPVPSNKGSVRSNETSIDLWLRAMARSAAVELRRCEVGYSGNGHFALLLELIECSSDFIYIHQWIPGGEWAGVRSCRQRQGELCRLNDMLLQSIVMPARCSGFQADVGVPHFVTSKSVGKPILAAQEPRTIFSIAVVIDIRMIEGSHPQVRRCLDFSIHIYYRLHSA